MDRIMEFVTVRGLVLMPGGTVSFDLGREQSKQAVKRALKQDSEIFIICQRNIEIDQPQQEDLYNVGMISRIVQVDTKKKDMLRIVVHGMQMAELQELVYPQESRFPMAKVQEIQEVNNLTKVEEETYRRSLLERVEVFLESGTEKEVRLLVHLTAIQDLSELIFELTQYLNFRFQDKQSILEAKDLRSRAELLGRLLSDEIAISKMRLDIANKMKTSIGEKQKRNIYREQIRVLKQELGEEEDQDEQADCYEKQIEELEANEEVKEKIRKAVQRFRSMTSYMSESSVLQDYIDTMLAMPWDYVSEENTDLAKAERILEKDHYGLEKIKERIVEYLAVHIYHQDSDAPILCLVGPPGTGKTSIAKSIARALDRRYERICLGGVKDEAEIRGHRKTYVGAMPGRIATAMRHAGTSNPVLLLDEIDKMGTDHRGDISSAMLEVLDSAQNSQFRDHYLETPMDLSRVLFIATANSVDTIPKPLLDRMEVISVSSYLEPEKYEIARQYLIPQQIARHGLTKKDISFGKGAIYAIIRGYTREAGVRNLERTIAKVCRKVVKQIMDEDVVKLPMKITAKNIEMFLGCEKYNEKTLKKRSEIGLVHGLAWTSAGGDTLDIEAIVLPGTGKVTFTGNMGDVMKESAQLAALSVRARAGQEGVEDSFFQEHDIHLHIPEGAVPKDGPSAGITMATAIYSAVTQKAVDYNLAMTGELSLLGQVLPIGGLREKIVAAKARKIHKILVPKENRKDIEELSEEVREGLTIVYVSTLEEVLREAIV